MQYITRKDATNKHKISFVTLDKYLRAGKIHTRKVKGGGILIDQKGLEEYIDLKNQMGVVFEKKSLFDDMDTNKQEVENKEKQIEPETSLVVIGGYQNIIKQKDDLLEKKSQELVKQEKQTRYWSNSFFFVLALLIAFVLFVLVSFR